MPRLRIDTTTDLDLCLDQFGVHLPILYPGGNSNKHLSTLLCFFMRFPLWFWLYLDTVHDQWVEIKHGPLHLVFPCLENEDDGYWAFREDLRRV